MTRQRQDAGSRGAAACLDVQRRLGLYLDARLSAAARAVVDRHLRECGACRKELAAWSRLSAAARTLRRDAAPRELAMRARATVFERAQRARRPRRWPAWGARLVVAAAAIVLVGFVGHVAYRLGYDAGRSAPGEADGTAVAVGGSTAGDTSSDVPAPRKHGDGRRPDALERGAPRDVEPEVEGPEVRPASPGKAEAERERADRSVGDPSPSRREDAAREDAAREDSAREDPAGDAGERLAPRAVPRPTADPNDDASSGGDLVAEQRPRPLTPRRGPQPPIRGHVTGPRALIARSKDGQPQLAFTPAAAAVLERFALRETVERELAAALRRNGARVEDEPLRFRLADDAAPQPSRTDRATTGSSSVRLVLEGAGARASLRVFVMTGSVDGPRVRVSTIVGEVHEKRRR